MNRQRRLVASGLAAAVVSAVLAAVTVLPARSTTTPSKDRVIHWEEAKTIGAPEKRFAAAMAYQEASQQTILFGGTDEPDGTPAYGDTWAFDGTIWSRIASTGPPARQGHAMVYDATRRKVVLFGGRDNDNRTALGDTWTWDSVRGWVDVSPAEGPTARAYTSMAYDAGTSRVVLFGGEAPDGQPLGDTWIWDGTRWTELNPGTSPPRRSRAAMAYSPSTNTALVFGGWDGAKALGDTWTWDGATATWGQENVASPERRQGHVMAYHSASDQIVLVGGAEDATDMEPRPCCGRDTWTWDGDDWGTGPVQAPSPMGFFMLPGYVGDRVAPAMAEDRLGRLALFGGRYEGNEFRDTQVFIVPAPVTTPSTPTPPAEVCSIREAGVPAAAPPPTTSATGAAASSKSTQGSGTTVGGVSAWKQEGTLTGPSPREGAAMAYDAVNNETILFGGFARTGDPCVHDDTWAWNGTAWKLKEPAGDRPSARYGHAMAYDAERRRIVLFGGSHGSGDQADTWAWDGTRWAPLDTGAAPSPRSRHTMAYDSARKQVVLLRGRPRRRAAGTPHTPTRSMPGSRPTSRRPSGPDGSSNSVTACCPREVADRRDASARHRRQAQRARP